MLEHFPSMYEALSPIPSTDKKEYLDNRVVGVGVGAGLGMGGQAKMNKILTKYVYENVTIKCICFLKK